jgi:hypothetical protein
MEAPPPTPPGIAATTFAALEAAPGDVAMLMAEVEQIPSGRLACLIYTSGTGGNPKGVMLPHRSMLANCASAKALIDQGVDLKDKLDGDDDKALVILREMCAASDEMATAASVGDEAGRNAAHKRLSAAWAEARALVTISRASLRMWVACAAMSTASSWFRGKSRLSMARIVSQYMINGALLKDKARDFLPAIMR